MKTIIALLFVISFMGCKEKQNKYLISYEAITTNGSTVQGQCFLAAYLFGTNEVEFIQTNKIRLGNEIGSNNIIIINAIKMEDLK